MMTADRLQAQPSPRVSRLQKPYHLRVFKSERRERQPDVSLPSVSVQPCNRCEGTA